MAACRVPTVIHSQHEEDDLLAEEGLATSLRTEKAASRGSDAIPTAIGMSRRNMFKNSITNVNSGVQGRSQK